MKKLVTIVILFFLFLFATSSKAELQLEINVDSTILFRGDTLIEIPVYLSNFTDTIAAFELWFQLDRPDIALFQMSLDTTGSIVSHWSPPLLSSLSGQNTDIRILWFATGPSWSDALLPQTGGKLFTLLLEPVNSPAFPSSTEALILPQLSTLDNFNFSTPSGASIGVLTEEIIDTSYFFCDSWVGETCLSWVQVPGLPADSLEIDTILHSVLDTSAVHTSYGIITTTCCNYPGDMNSSNSSANIADLTFRVNYMFKGGSAPFCLSSADINNDCAVDILDLTDLVYYMFCHARKPCGDIYCGCID